MERSQNVFTADVIMDQAGTVYPSGCSKILSCRVQKVRDVRLATEYYNEGCPAIEVGTELPIDGSAVPNVLTVQVVDPVLGTLYISKTSYDANIGDCNDCCTPLPVLAAPTLVATPGNTLNSLTWGAVPNATNYVVQRSTNFAFASGVTTIYNGALLLFSDTGRTNGTPYYYRITAQGNSELYADSAYGYATATPAP